LEKGEKKSETLLSKPRSRVFARRRTRAARRRRAAPARGGWHVAGDARAREAPRRVSSGVRVAVRNASRLAGDDDVVVSTIVVDRLGVSPRGRPRGDRRRRARGPDDVHPAVAPGRGLAAGRASSRAHHAPPGALREQPHEGDLPPDARSRRRGGSRAAPPGGLEALHLRHAHAGRRRTRPRGPLRRESLRRSLQRLRGVSHLRRAPVAAPPGAYAPGRARSRRTRGALPGSRCAPSASTSRRTKVVSPRSFDQCRRLRTRTTVRLASLARRRESFARGFWSRRTARAAVYGRGSASKTPAHPPCSTS
jgi:hypothetical protein